MCECVHWCHICVPPCVQFPDVRLCIADPYLTAEIARVWIRGIQGSPHAKHMKVGTISKHFVAHTGPESPNNKEGVGRMAFDTVVSQRALHSHFLSPFKAAAEVWSHSMNSQTDTVSDLVCMCDRPAQSGLCARTYLLIVSLDQYSFFCIEILHIPLVAAV